MHLFPHVFRNNSGYAVLHSCSFFISVQSLEKSHDLDGGEHWGDNLFHSVFFDVFIKFWKYLCKLSKNYNLANGAECHRADVGQMLPFFT